MKISIIERQENIEKKSVKENIIKRIKKSLYICDLVRLLAKQIHNKKL